MSTVEFPKPTRVEVDAEYSETVVTFTYSTPETARFANNAAAELLASGLAPAVQTMSGGGNIASLSDVGEPSVEGGEKNCGCV